MTTKKFILTITLLLQLSIVFAQVEIQYIPLQSSDPEVSLEDLNSLNQHFDGVKIVGMGESTHGSHEFFTMRHRMFKYLVLNHGFNTFFLEADYANCLPIDRYIKGADGNLDKLVKNIDLWPWSTREMANLIKWMKIYNKQHPTSMLNFIGCDMQKIKSTVTEIDHIISKYSSTSVDTTGYTNFFDLTVYKDKKVLSISYYDSLLEYKDNIISKLPLIPSDKFTYQTLSKHFNQIVKEKFDSYLSYRDIKMAENILYHMNNDQSIKGFFWAHNTHTFNIYRNHKDLKKALYRAGGILKKQLGKEYYMIAQDFDQGGFNAYNLLDREGDRENPNNYLLRPVTIEPSIKNTFGEYFREVKDSILFIPSTNLRAKKHQYLKMHTIGAAFISFPKNPNQGPYFASCRGCYDAVILIKQVRATELLLELQD